MIALGVDLGRTAVTLAVLEVTGRMARVVGTWRAPCDDASRAAVLRAAVAQHCPAPDAVASAVPGGAVSFRLLRLPFADAARLAATVPFELENAVPSELEAALTPFTVIERERAATVVLAATTPVSHVRSHLDALAAAGLEPAVVDLGALAVAGLVQLSGQDVVLVEPRDDGAVAVLRGGALAGLRVIDGADRAALEGQARWSALALADEHGLPPLFVVDDGAAEAADRLAGELGAARASRARLLPTWAAGVPLEHLRAAALAARAAGLVSLGLNFRVGELSYHAPSEEARRQLRSTALLAGATALLGILAFGIALGERRAELGTLQDEVARNVTSVMPGAARGTERARLEAAIDGLEKRRETLSGAAKGHPPTLEVLRAIAESVPDKTPFEVDDFSLDTDGVRIHARTNSYESVDVLKRALQGLPSVRDPQVKDVKTGVDGRVEFRAVLSFAREGSS